MKKSEFAIGKTFYTATGKWRCTDIGTRVIVAIHLARQDDTYADTPPYYEQEVVFDETDFPACIEDQAEAIEAFGASLRERIQNRPGDLITPDDFDERFVVRQVWSRLKSFQVSEFKFVEIQVTRWSRTRLLGFEHEIRKNMDHPGFELCLTLFRLEFRLAYYDRRHWDSKTHQLY